ncbi:MAG: nucleotidyltransferase [Steroidobacteraceae bacterium]
MAEGLADSLQAALTDLLKWIATARIPAMVIGGVAASVLGRPRLTQDIDALAILPEGDWENAVDAAAQFGIVPRIPDVLDFARRSRVLLLRHTKSGIDLDITMGGLQFEQSAVENSVVHEIGGLSVRLPRIEDLLVMKAIARRPKDLEDIRGLLVAHPGANIAAARRWVREFAASTGMSDMLEEFDRLVAGTRSKN